MWDVNVRTMAPLVSNDWIEFLDLKTAARGPTRRRTAPPLAYRARMRAGSGVPFMAKRLSATA
jgi:hypothetical protein